MDFLTDIALDKIGFAFAAIANLFFFLLTLATRVNNLPRLFLLNWSLLTVIWASYYMVSGAAPYASKASLALELGRYLLLLLFLLTALGKTDLSVKEFFKKRANLVLIGFVIGWIALCTFDVFKLNLIFTVSLALCILQLALLEAIYRKAQLNRWQYKPLVFGISLSVLLDFVLLAESALFGEIDNQLWAARGFVFASVVPLLILSVRRIKAWGINVYVSRDIVIQSSFVLAAAIYICIMAVIGFYIRYVGGTWSNLLQTVLIAGGLGALALFALSGAVKRNVKVFIEKNFFANKFDYRQKWLELTSELRLVDITKAEQYHTILQAWLNSISYHRGSLLKLENSSNFTELASINRSALNQHETTLIKEYIAAFSQKNWILDLSDTKDPFSKQFFHNDVDIQLLIPVYSDNKLWGLCVMNTPDIDRLHLNWELRDYLKLVAEQISSYLQLMQASQKLSENAQFAAFSRMSAFVVHDLKNVKAQLDMMLANSKKHKHNPEFIDDSFDTLAAMQQRLQHMLTQLSSKRAESSKDSLVNVSKVVAEVVDKRCANRLPKPKYFIENDAELIINKERFASVLYHLIDNAQHATMPSGDVHVHVKHDNKALFIIISDTGCGMSENFINTRLFKAFDSTKGNAGMGVGAYDALHFAKEHQGQLKVKSTEGVGTTFTLILPLHSESELL